MKVRTDVVKMYKEIHGWVGILSGLALFIAFFAGAITMFEGPLQRWASSPTNLAAPVSIERTPELVQAILAEHPEAARSYDVHIEPGPEKPARVSWTVRGDEHDEPQVFYAALESDGSLHVEQEGPSPVAQFVDVLHQQVGLPFDHELAMPIMGAIALLYVVALVSGIVVLLPSLVSDFFALRVGKNAKRQWLDVHNVLGVISLPFHLVMALTAVVFAFHDQFYDLQGATFMASPAPVEQGAPPPPTLPRKALSPSELVTHMESQAPGFTVQSINYRREADGGTHVRIAGSDPRYGLRGPTFGMVEVDAYTGEITEADYMPGKQDGWGATISSFFALHFGSFGGAPIRWSYFLLGMGGAMLFYTGNLLWVESRRKKERKGKHVVQSRSTRILGALTVGVPLGSVAGISATVAAAKPLGLGASMETHSWIYYVVFLLFTGWALYRGAARAGSELLLATVVAVLLIPLASVASIGSVPWNVPFVDVVAVVLAAAIFGIWRSATRRAKNGPRDSVWSSAPVSAESGNIARPGQEATQTPEAT